METPRHLPPLRDTIVDRTDEMLHLAGLIRRGAARLITITGTAGAGKSRLALEAAHRAAPDFDDGAYFVPLASVTSDDLVAPAIASQLGLGGEASGSGEAALNALIGSRHLLLVLDNLEQLLHLGPLVGELMDGCPHLQILATSRAPLGLYGEHLLPLPPLLLPDPAAVSGEAMESPALQLFLRRAHAVFPTFDVDGLTESDAQDVASICRRLDGLPLAIELVAARVRVLPVAQIRALMSGWDRDGPGRGRDESGPRWGTNSLDIAAGGPRDHESRHRSLRDAISWSYDLLPPEQQLLLRSVAVCAGGFTLDLAMAVAGPVYGGRVATVLDDLSALVDSSLVERASGNPSRWRLLETIRAYAWERLVAAGEDDLVSQRLAQAMVDLANRAQPQLLRSGRAAAFARLDIERANLQAALAWSLAAGTGSEPSRVDLGVRLVGALWVWFRGRDIAGGRYWAARAVELCRIAPDPDLLAIARVRFVEGQLALVQGDIAVAQLRLSESAAQLRDLSGGVATAELALVLSYLAQAFAAEPAGLEAARESLALSEATSGADGSRDAARARHVLGICLRTTGQAPAAAEQFAASAAAFRRLGDGWLLALPLAALGEMALASNDLGGAKAALGEAVELFRENGDRFQAGRTGLLLGQAAELMGDSTVAGAAYAAATEAMSALGDLTGMLRGLDRLATAANAQGARGLAARLARGAGLNPAELAALLGEAVAAIISPGPGPAGAPTPHGLSPREVEVLRLIAAGRRDGEIATALVISPSTVHRHVNNIFAKLSVSNRTEAAAFAFRLWPAG